MSVSHLSERLEACRQAGGFDPRIVEPFGALLEGAEDAEVFRMSPLRYARQAGLAETQAVDLFLHATHSGLLDFTWGVLCPGCAAFLSTPGGLRGLTEAKRCNFCRIPVVGSVDDNVEVAFTVSPSVRRIRFHEPDELDPASDALRAAFSSSVGEGSCLGHFIDSVLHAGRLPAGGTGVATLRLDPGNYLLTAPATHANAHFRVIEGEGPAELSLDLFDGRVVPAVGQVKAGDVVLRLANRTKRQVPYAVAPDAAPPLEVRTPDMVPPPVPLEPYLTGKRLIASHTFRELFHAQSIPSDAGLELKSLTVLFTDLKSSTEMYERVGDLRAYDLVRRHFGVLQAAVASRGGAIVKTIGDAIMASFAEPLPALDAAAAMHSEIDGVDGEEPLALKIGLHLGPCIAVELNERLDYFGRTVNMAARVQGLAEGGETVITPPVYEAPGAAELLAAEGLAGRHEQVVLKGIEGTCPVVRLRA